MRTAWIPTCLLLVAMTACNQGARPGAETASTGVPQAPASPQPEAASSPAAAPPAESSSQQPGPAQTGDVALPPSSAKPWNNAQSDGNAPTGDRGIETYQQIIQRNRDMFRRCYDQSLKTHPGIQGKVTLKFVLNPKGDIKEASIDRSASDITEPDLETCMVAALKALSFPASTRGMESTVRYPFNFFPRAPAASSR
jgi:TonB family protein